MRTSLKLLSLAGALAIGVSAMPAFAAEGVGGVAPGSSKQICLPANRIQSTEVIDAQTIMFNMVDGKRWQNNLAAPCHTSRRNNPISFQQRNNKICGNVEMVTMLRSGESCLLGDFVEAPDRLIKPN